jgi:hypothetical protein
MSEKKMPRCYTCQQEIIFDKNIVSKTGKQIPLWPDKKNTHGHDEDGNATRGPLPTGKAFSSPTTTYPPKFDTPKDIPKTSEGGSTLDLKRLRVMVEDLTNYVRGLEQYLKTIDEKIEAHVIVDSNRYEGQMSQMFNVWKPFFNTQGEAASDIWKKQQQQQQKIDDTSLVNHSKIADENIAAREQKNKTKFVDESKQKFSDDKIPDSEDFQYLKDDDDESDNEGVIDEE